MKQLTDEEIQALENELKDFNEAAAAAGVKKVQTRNLQNSENDVLTFKGSKLSDFMFTDTSTSVKWSYFRATNGQRVSVAAICGVVGNGLNLQGDDADARCLDFAKKVISSEDAGYSIKIVRIKTIPTRKVGEQQKQLLFEVA